MKKFSALTIMFIAFSMPAQAKVLVQQMIYSYAARGDVARIKQIQERGYSIDSYNHEGNTALCEAVLRGNRNAANTLIRLGADRNAECMQRISNYYRNNPANYAASTSSAVGEAESSGTFLGMGATGWTIAGVAAAGVGIAAAAGGGGGGSGGSSAPSDDTSATCVNGTMIDDECICNEGWTGSTCKIAKTCPYNTKSCTGGYEETGNTCKSGNVTYRECKAKTVPEGYTITPCGEGYTQVDTFLSGNDTYYKCTPASCTGYDYTICPTGYAQSDSCKSGDVIKIKCDNCDLGYLPFDGACYQDLHCASVGSGCYQTKNTCVCDGGSTSDVVGLLFSKENYSADEMNANNSTISLSGSGTQNIYGIKTTNTTINIHNALSDVSNHIIGKIETVNSGSGNVYGMYGTPTTDAYNSYAYERGTADGSINITNNGTGNAFGIYTGYGTNVLTASLKQAYPYEEKAVKGTIKIRNTNSGNAYGIASYGAAYNLDIRTPPVIDSNLIGTPVSSKIIISNEGTGKAYGLLGGGVYNFSPSSFAGDESMYSGDATISITNKNTGSAYGLYGRSIYNSNSDKNNAPNITSKVIMVNENNGNVYGAFAKTPYDYPTAYNYDVIELVNNNNGQAMGMVTVPLETIYNGSITNAGQIIIHNLGYGTAVGINAGEKTRVTNSGTIVIDRESYANTDTINDIPVQYTKKSNKGGTAIGIYGANGARIENSGTITISGASTAYGIYAETGATVSNTGTITIDGTSCTGSNCSNANNAIKLNGSKLFQNGTLSANSLDLDDFGGEVIANSDAKFVVKDNISGDLAINNNVVQDGFDTTYKIANMVEADDTSGLNLKSQSALFDAKLENDTDAVMTMKSFDSVVKDDSVAEFLQNNYAAQNNEKLFSTLKSSETVASLNSNVDALFGKEMFSRMAFEDISMLREINFDMNQNLFNQPEGYFALGGNISPSNYDSNLGSVGRYSLNGYNDGKRSFAIGMSIADIRTDNGNGANNRFDRSFVMSAPYGYRTDNGFEFITTPKLGYTNGTYRRTGLNGMNYNGNVQKRMVALMNEARYPFDFSKMTLTAALEFNAIGYNIKGGEDDQDYSLRIKSQNHASVETGFGLTASKEINLTKDSKLKLSGGVAFYHEFANPYELELGMNGMSGTYKMRNDKYGDNRTVVRFGLDYQLQDYLDVTANLLNNIDKENRTDARIDMKYNF